MDRDSLLELLDWLDGAKAPHLLQLPRSEWDRLRRRGQLPWLLGSGEDVSVAKPRVGPRASSTE